jgi:opacity protein-like surface antigen
MRPSVACDTPHRRPIVVLLLIVAPAFAWCTELLAAPPPGSFGFSMDLGIADTTSSEYGSDDALMLSLDYQRTGYAAYRATAGFFTVAGRTPVSGTGGTRDADAFFVAGNVALTPRFAVLNPFLTAGVGFYSVRLTDAGGSHQNLELGVNWGAGLDVQLSRHFMLGGEFTMHHVTGDVSATVRIVSVGGRFLF